jgi:hypothetical protein
VALRLVKLCICICDSAILSVWSVGRTPSAVCLPTPANGLAQLLLVRTYCNERVCAWQQVLHGQVGYIWVQVLAVCLCVWGGG